MRRIALLVVLLASPVPLTAQVQSRPTDPPLVTADNESWFALREPINVAGENYYPAGATVFFNGNTMVRTGHYNGVPVYADTTIEPFSVLYVPMTRGLMQPYEKPRSGALAGTTGSRTPSFPVRISSAGTPSASAGIAMAAVAPTAAPQPGGAIGVYTPGAVGTAGRATPGAVGTAGSAAVRRAQPPIVSLMRPQSNDGLWIRYGGATWVSRGAAIARGSDFTQVGEYAGFPVYARAGSDDDVIYLPTRAGLVAPYWRK